MSFSSHLAFAFLSVLHISDVLSAGAGNFYLGTEKVTRDEAVQLCDERFLELATIKDANENEAIFNLLKGNGTKDAFWVSGQRKSNEEIWTWLDGEKIEYFKWAPDEPNGNKADESCIEVFSKNFSVLWNDQPCRDQRGFICAPKRITENFYLGMEKVSRDQAEQLCENRSMDLVSIQTPEKNEAIFYLLKANGIDSHVWTSGLKNFDGKNWTWLNGDAMQYFNWGPGEPNGARGSENCVEVYTKESQVLWNDHPCGDKRGYICEKKPECETKLLNVTVDDKMCSISTNVTNTPTKKFYLSTQQATRAQALQRCSDMFMQLASLRNEDENTDLYELMRKKETASSYWISGNKKLREPWKWLDNANITYFKWSRGEPNNGAADNICMEVVRSTTALTWNDQFCSRVRFFVCEKLNPVVQITVEGNLTISQTLETSKAEDCTVVLNRK